MRSTIYAPYIMRNVQKHASQIVCISFLTMIFIGTVLLKLRMSSISESLSWLDAIFMSTSAVCVTGLSVVDVGADFTLFGQGILLLLIQLGGVGIMTLSLFFFLIAGQKISLSATHSLGGVSKESESYQLRKSLGLILIITFLFEMIGMILLFAQSDDKSFNVQTLFPLLFHSISAFCNSGFSLYSNSLTQFQDNIGVLSVFMGLIMIGGFGFIVISEIGSVAWNRIRRANTQISLHTRIVLLTSLMLIIGSTIIIWICEKNYLLSSLTRTEQWLNALFLSVTSRTAGFNTLDTSQLTNGTAFLLLFLMFIGGAPGSTAGGIKITTFLVILALVRGHVRGDGMTHFSKRSVPADVIAKALAILTASILLVCIGIWALQISEVETILGINSRHGFLDLLFEAVSAFGTVGLSTGVTPHLSSTGKIIIIIMMFAGRIGPLTIGLAVLGRKAKAMKIRYAEEKIWVS